MEDALDVINGLLEGLEMSNNEAENNASIIKKGDRIALNGAPPAITHIAAIALLEIADGKGLDENAPRLPMPDNVKAYLKTMTDLYRMYSAGELEDVVDKIKEAKDALINKFNKKKTEGKDND